MAALWIADDAREAVAELGITNVSDGWREDLPGEVINDRGDRQVVCLRTSAYPRRLYLKRWRCLPDSPLRFLPISRRLRLRARIERANLEQLREIGIQAPAPLVFGEIPGHWGPVATILILEGLDDHVCSSEWIALHPEDKGQVAAGIAQILATLHNHGLYYRSPGLKHFYVHWEGPGNNLALIDVPRLDSQRIGLTAIMSGALGLDAPSRERDLSKAWLTLAGELNLEAEEFARFWEVYFNTAKEVLNAESLRKKVEQDAWRRLGGRFRRIERKSL